MGCVLFLMASGSPPAAARRFIGVNPWCRTASHKRLCTQMAKGATTWHGASANAMIATLELAKRIQSMSDRLIRPAIAFLEPQSRESISASCAEDFELAISDLEDSIKALEANDMGTLTVHLSAAYSTDCSDALAEFGVDDPLAKVSGHYLKMVDNCLAVVRQI
ncbi:hypothetical protein F511_21067 [Dorcoceras hygrometricum]|uniref:Pectinesterase inhibitor domain-containing protein n=1 Tax=Dorcoceras hygrometricum TaxID=472368 RepID=A0A2Z7D1X2_9LAMI|nr:hypothetical protein F511_21067 [Dorcoceras hygrometricum]